MRPKSHISPFNKTMQHDDDDARSSNIYVVSVQFYVIFLHKMKLTSPISILYTIISYIYLVLLYFFALGGIEHVSNFDHPLESLA
jgi:hypothetical protein